MNIGHSGAFWGILLLCAFSSTAQAAHGGKHDHHHPPEAGTAAHAVSDPAFQVYDAVVATCARQIMPIPKNKDEARPEAMKNALNPDKIKDLQKCMSEKGVKADFDNYHKKSSGKAGKPDVLDTEMLEDIEEIREVMESGAAAPVEAAPAYTLPVGQPTILQSPPPVRNEGVGDESGNDESPQDNTQKSGSPRLWVTPE